MITSTIALRCITCIRADCVLKILYAYAICYRNIYSQYKPNQATHIFNMVVNYHAESGKHYRNKVRFILCILFFYSSYCIRYSIGLFGPFFCFRLAISFGMRFSLLTIMKYFSCFVLYLHTMKFCWYSAKYKFIDDDKLTGFALHVDISLNVNE